MPPAVPACSLALLSLLVPGPIVAQRDPLGGLDAYIRKAMTEWQVPGLAIAVVRRDSVVYLRGFGLRQVGKAAQVDPETIFALSSNSKAFTAAGVGILVDEGRLSWDDAVVEHLPWFQLRDPWVTRQVTVRDLLSHRIAGDLGTASLALWAMTTLGREEILRRLQYLELGPSRFRQSFEYNNPNIMAASLVTAAISGTSWDDFMKTRVFGPLGMTSATTSVRELWDSADVAPCYYCDLPNRPVGYERAKIPNIVMAHMPTDTGPVAIPWRMVDNIAGAGSINANVADVAKWIRMLLGRGTYRGRRILTPGTVEELFSPQMVMSGQTWFASGEVNTYGLGWFLTQYRGRKLVLHGGSITGFLSGIAMLPDESLGVAVLTNVHLPNRVPDALAAYAFDRHLGLPERDWSGEWLAEARSAVERLRVAERELASRRVSGTWPSRPLGQLVGVYHHPAFGKLVASEHAGSLRLVLSDVYAGDVEHWHHDLFRVTWRGPRPQRHFFRYVVNAAGQVARLEIEGLGVFAAASR